MLFTRARFQSLLNPSIARFILIIVQPVFNKTGRILEGLYKDWAENESGQKQALL